MRDWTQFSAALSEWRDNPVTLALREAMARVLDRRKAALVQSFLSGREDLAADRKAFLAVEQWVEDFFEASAEDVRAVMESDDGERIRHPADVGQGAGQARRG